MTIEFDIRNQVVKLRRQRASTAQALEWERSEVARLREELRSVDERTIEWEALAAERGIDLSEFTEDGEPVKKEVLHD